MSHRHTVTVVAADLDELGHVNNARYLDYLERGRTAWYEQRALIALSANGRAPSELGTVVVNINIDFRAECRSGEQLQIVTRPARAGSKSFVVVQHIEKADGTLAAEAQVTSVLMDMSTRKAVALSPAVKALFAA